MSQREKDELAVTLQVLPIDELVSMFDRVSDDREREMRRAVAKARSEGVPEEALHRELAKAAAGIPDEIAHNRATGTGQRLTL